MSYLIQNKYKPTEISEIIGNINQIDYIKEWLDSYTVVKEFLKSNGLLKKSSKGRKKKLINITDIELEYSKRKGNLLITGPHGSGKSTIISIILSNYNYDVINLNTLDSKVKIDTELIIKFSTNYEYENDKKPILLIDESLKALKNGQDFKYL